MSQKYRAFYSVAYCPCGRVYTGQPLWAGQRYALRADVLNLFDSDDRDIEYFYASRLAGEPLEGVEDRHFHRFEPRQLRVTLRINL